MKKMIGFCENEVPFKWNYWMTLHAIWIQFNINLKIQFYLHLIQFNSNLNEKKCNYVVGK